MNRKEYLDIIFKGFETSYGAYPGRVRTGSRTGISFLITLILMLAILLPMVPRAKVEDHSGSTMKAKHRKVIQYSQLSAPPPIETIKTTPPKQKAPAPKMKVASKKFVKPTVKPDEEVEEAEYIPSQEELKFVNPGKTTEEGDSLHQLSGQDMDQYDEIEIQYDLEEAEVVPVEESPPPPKPKAKEKVYRFTEKQASFPGGAEELYKFLGRYLIYPRVALDNRIEGRAVIQFIVQKDGAITDIEVLRDPGGECAAEAVRVIQRMPPWDPAEHNGQTVASSFTLPVEFKIMDVQE